MYKRKKEYEQEEREKKKYRISAVASRRIDGSWDENR